MSDSNRYRGRITITPPLTAAEIRETPTTRDMRLNVVDETVETPTGAIVTSKADAIVPPEAPCNGYDVKDDIQALVDRWSDTHTFAGHIEVSWDPGYFEPGETTVSRFVLRGGRVVEVKPTLVWPDEDGAR